MNTAQSVTKTAENGAAPLLFDSATRELSGRSARTFGNPEVKKVFELRNHIGKRFVIESPLIRITPDPKGFVMIEAFNGGVWSPVMTTPHYFDLTSKEAQ